MSPRKGFTGLANISLYSNIDLYKISTLSQILGTYKFVTKSILKVWIVLRG
jgi:hypothetical protein